MKPKPLSLLFLMCICIFTSKTHAQEDKPNPNVKNIIIVFKTHFDNGYTDYAELKFSKESNTIENEFIKINIDPANIYRVQVIVPEPE